jgi:hypothetical protein
MLFGMITLVLVAAVAFYQYIQGFFSAMISSILVILAALIAVAYHEPVAEALLAKPLPAHAHAVVLVVMFALTYVLMRLLADKLVPGNVRFSLLVDKIGAGVFGLLAGVFTVGVLAIAAQLLPFGPSIGGYSRFALVDRPDISFKNTVRRLYYTKVGVWNELEHDRYDSASAAWMFPLPCDGAVLGLTSILSAGGSLAGDRPFAQVHPDYATELFGNRLGQPFNGGDVLYSSGSNGVTVSQVYTSKSVLNDPEDIEMQSVRGAHSVAVTSEGNTPVVVRVTFAGSMVTTPASVRLVVKGKDDYVDYCPIGSYQHGERLLLTRPDDPISVDPGPSVDFVFMVDSESLIKTDKSELRLPRGTFLEAKRAARVDLSDKEISQTVPGGSENVGVLTKTKQQ